MVLDGAGTALIGDEETPIRGGHVIARPGGSRLAHAFRAGDEGLLLLAVGQPTFPRVALAFWAVPVSAGNGEISITCLMVSFF